MRTLGIVILALSISTAIINVQAVHRKDAQIQTLINDLGGQRNTPSQIVYTNERK